MRPHVSINVKNVSETVFFYEKVFDTGPQKQTENYAKFDLKNPALNFTVQSNPQGETSKVNHFGIEVDTAEAVSDWESRLTSKGILSQPEKNTDCCFARQDKIWFKDPDGNSWEIFYVKEQLLIMTNAEVCLTGSNERKCC